MAFDINRFRNLADQQLDQYQRRINHLKGEGIETDSIEVAVNGAIDNIETHKNRSFVIYGEPQSGKTEMMIALTARLLDQSHQIIIHLLNDNVSLLDQNLRRFKASGLAPAPVNFKDIIDRSIVIDHRPFVIFCKKNPSDLNKLIDKLGNRDGFVVIDDEADFASPNSQINKGTRSKINHLILQLLKKKGIYVGVTATPARLDLNNTFENDHEKWVPFPPHSSYTGQEVFFPLSPTNRFELNLISPTGDDPKFIREALFRFMVNSAYLNLHPDIHIGSKGNYTLLIHTSGKKVDHKRDFEVLQKIFSALSNKSGAKFEKYIKSIWDVANNRFPGHADTITKFIVTNITRNEIKILNSDQDVLNKGTAPDCPFTVIIGGNIISRGVTFDNLLSMFFTRDVKHKLQQDTYIQRARMFGARGKYLKYFELTIPRDLYADWQKCFVFHRLALKSIDTGNGAPVWLSDKRVAAVASGSIDKSNVSIDSGEMSFALFDYQKSKQRIDDLLKSGKDPLTQLKEVQILLGESNFPEFLIEFIETHTQKSEKEIKIHDPHTIENMKDADQDNITRKKGFMGGANFSQDTGISHHVRIHYNKAGKGRVSYKYVSRITFLKNTKNSRND